MSPSRLRPLGGLVVAAALLLPTLLTLFVMRPALFEWLALPAILLVAVAASLPVVLLCGGIARTLLRGAARVREARDGRPADAEAALLLLTGILANLVLFGVTTLAYVRPIRVGATYIWLALFLALFWVGAALAMGVAVAIAERSAARLGTATEVEEEETVRVRTVPAEAG